MTTPGRQPAAGRRRRRTRIGVELSRETYVDAAVRLVGNRGARVLNARALGAEVGADPTALYRYFSGTDDVLRAVADHMIGRALSRYTPAADWVTSLRDLARVVYAVYTEDFPLTGLPIPDRSTGLPNERLAAEVTIGLLRDAGFDEPDAARWTRTFADFLLGQALVEGAFAGLPPADSAFEDALDLLLRGLVSVADGEPRQTP